MSRRELLALGVFTLVGALRLFLHLQDEAVSWPMGGALHVGAAASIANLEGWVLPSGRPFAVFGPLYPALLAVGRAVGAEVVPTVAAVHAVGWSIGVVSSYVLGRAVAGTWGGVVGAASYAALGSTNVLLRTILPDGTGIALTLACLALAASPAPTTTRRLVTLGALAGLAATTRYMALFTLVPVVAVTLARREGLRRAGAFAALAAAPVGLWMVRNQILTGHLTGMARFADRFNDRELAPWEDLVAAFRIFVLDLFSPSAMGLRHVVYLREVPLVPTLAAVVGIFVVAAVAVTRNTPWSDTGRLCAAFAGTHVAATLLAWAIGNNDPLVSRYLAPSWPPLLVAILDLTARSRFPVAIAPASVLAWIAGTGAAKSAAILSHDPHGDLIERHRSLPTGDTWRTTVPWEPREPLRGER